LRQLIEAGLAQEAAKAGDARIGSLHLHKRRFFGTLAHRAEFEDGEDAIVEAVTLLAIKDRAFAVAANGERDHRHRDRKAHKHGAANDEI